MTRALTDFIARSVEISPVWQPRPRPTVSPLPADQMQVAGLSFYLYHLAENPHLRTPPPIDPAAGHVRHAPMAIDLHYQMTASPGGTSANELLEAQLLMGCALKALHDEPVVDDGTTVNGTAILANAGLDGADNRLRINLQPVAPSDAVSYWVAGSQAARLAAYYQAYVVLLEPQPPARRAGRVLRYGVAALVSGAPRLARSEARLAFTLPDGQAQEIVVSPAAVPYDGALVLHGVNLASERTELLLRGGGFEQRRAVDASWGLTAQATQVIATVRQRTDGEIVVPGVYSAAVGVARTVSGRLVQQTSNETPIQITPNVTAISAIGGGGFAVDGGVFDDATIMPANVEVHLGANSLARVATAPAPGQFRVVDPSRIELAPPADAVPGADLPMRILVNGAESPPRWIRVP